MIEMGVYSVIGYAIAFVLELSRFFFRGAVRNFFAVIFVLIGFAVHTIFLYYRHVAATGNINGAETYFFMTAWGLVLVYLYLICYHRGIPFGLFFLPIVLFAMVCGGVISYITPNEPTAGLVVCNPPFLKMFHAITFFAATLSISIGFVAGLLYLFQDWRLRHKRPTGTLLKLPTIEWSASLCRKALGASTFILASSIFCGCMLQPHLQSPNFVMLFDPLVIGTVVTFVFLFVFSGILPLRIFRSEGKQLAMLTLIAFVFLVVTLIFGILSKEAHWKRISLHSRQEQICQNVF
ncbi:MAG: hypothetical protein LBQ66_14060 [Planctomycetaceae bacterium]|nr:hypothetical protein [Planctomycetaceae bacterium]